MKTAQHTIDRIKTEGEQLLTVEQKKLIGIRNANISALKQVSRLLGEEVEVTFTPIGIKRKLTPTT